MNIFTFAKLGRTLLTLTAAVAVGLAGCGGGDPAGNGGDDAVPTGTINIPNFTALCKIGKEKAYPLTGTYALTADIDASASRNMNGGKGFEPIGSGNNSSSYFKGKFYGNGYTIKGLYINRPDEEDVGLFGYVLFGNISGVNLVGANITGGESTGGIVGTCNGSAILSESSVSGGTITGADYTGGLAGWSQQSTITDCYSTATVSGKNAGGLVGINSLMATISRSYAVSVVSGLYAGGLAGGDISGAINNSYSASTVTGGYYSGGLICKIATTTTITNCYAVGLVSAGANGSGGGFAGISGTPTITSCYWDIQTTGQSASADSLASGKTIAEMKQRGTYVDWDFTSIWDIGGGYPYLRSLGAPPLLKAPVSVASGAMFKTAAPPPSSAESERMARETEARARAEARRYAAEVSGR